MSENEAAGGRGWTLVTGGAGFIGSELVRQLVRRGRSVRVLDSLTTGRRDNLAAVLGGSDLIPGRRHGAGRCELMVGDIRDDAVLGPAFADVREVFHLACLGLRRSLRNPQESHEVNATGSLHVLMAARRVALRCFVHVSSSEVYGSGAVPRGGLDEDQATWPTTAYGAAKLAGEAYARSFHRVYDVPVVVIRPFNAYGPRSHHEGDAGEVIPRFLLAALAGEPLVVFGDGRQTRDFTFVRDVARGLRRAARRSAAIGETFNLGSGQEIAIGALADEIRRLCGRPDLEVRHAAPRPGDLRRLLADASRAEAVLGWVPRVGWKRGLRKVKEWLEASGRPIAEMLSEAGHSDTWTDPDAR